MPGAFGSSGYTPEGTEQQGSALNQALMGNLGKTQKGGYEDYGIYGKRWNPDKEGAFTPNANPSQSFTYKPGESGYDLQSKFNPSQYGSFTSAAQPNLKNEAEQYYGGILNQANEGTKIGAQAGMDMAAGTFGRRGIGRSGIANQGLGNVADTASRQMATNASNIGFQRAQDYNQLNQANAQLQQQNNQFNAGQRLGAATTGEEFRQKGLSGQGLMDQGMRQEKMQYYNTPIQQLMALYGANMGAPGNQAQQGWLSPMLGGVGSTLGGIGSFYK
jgi:hypothetical protein